MNKNSNTKSVVITSRWTDNYTYTVDVPAGSVIDMLNAAFALTNRDDRPFGNKVCSTSIGDILSVDDRCFIVEPCGFVEVSKDTSVAWERIDPRDAHMGFAYCAEHGLIQGTATPVE